MSTQKPASWAYAEEFVAESPVAERARERGHQLGCIPVLPGAAATLRLLAAALDARAVVEIGTGAGVSGLWLLEGMAPDGILTSIDVEPANQRAAREAFAEAGIPHQRTRLISGRALDVLPRLTDGAYDMVVVDGDKREYPAYVQQALRLLRRGGLLVLDNMLWHDKVADPAARDETTALLRDLGKELRERDDLLPVMLAAGDGMLAAVRR
ncbi:O-methyltransferase [Arsenicicoccus sp. oral taxon 190]|uniref:O-methyltransferase n=1 Tax=Arsenicicoccus sp. oral taxon 190 TaxID=1658671 RepID=UPI00067A10DE|nr:class I SAM-dependent methyltransferase [Arsenicicoccus sp. oral taxon 190]AKT51377.1 methyltransferase [Arsenicicoccus sp. oral taxon 190]